MPEIIYNSPYQFQLVTSVSNIYQLCELIWHANGSDAAAGGRMTDVSCPVCGGSVVIGLPRDATIERVETGADRETTDSGTTKTRVVHCPEAHGVAVTFSVESPEH